MSRCIALLERLCALSDAEWQSRLDVRRATSHPPEEIRRRWLFHCDPWDLWLVRDFAQTVCATAEPARRAERMAVIMDAVLPVLAGRELDPEAHRALAPVAGLLGTPCTEASVGSGQR